MPDVWIASIEEQRGSRYAVIRGTRTTVAAIVGRLDAGEALAELMDDYPHIPAGAFEAAAIYAREHSVPPPAPSPWRADPKRPG